MIASQDALYSIDLAESFKENKNTTKSVALQSQKDGRDDFPTITVNWSNFKTTKMQTGWKIHRIEEIHPVGDCALVCEDKSDALLVFFLVKGLDREKAQF